VRVPRGFDRMGDDHDNPPLARRVPGATRAASSASERLALPEALLQRMQAVVSAARAQAAEEQRLTNEEEAQREQAVTRDQEVPKPSASQARRMRAAGNGRKMPPGTAVPLLPTSSPAGWSNADDETSPLPSLTTSATAASAVVDQISAVPSGLVARPGSTLIWTTP